MSKLTVRRIAAKDLKAGDRLRAFNMAWDLVLSVSTDNGCTTITKRPGLWQLRIKPAGRTESFSISSDLKVSVLVDEAA